jgi:hypothetical protein
VLLAACGRTADRADDALGPALAVPDPVVVGLRSQPLDNVSAMTSSGALLVPTVAKKALLERNRGTLAKSSLVLLCSSRRKSFRWHER